MEDEIEVRVVVRGLKEPNLAAMAVVTGIKRSLFQVDSKPGEFRAEISSMAPGMCEPEAIHLDDDFEWQRGRDSNSRGFDANRTSNAAP